MNAHGPLRIEIFNDPMFQENGLLVWRADFTDAWIIDPGLPPQPMNIAAAVHARGLTPTAIVLTHCHGDHIAGITPLRALLGPIPVTCPDGELALLTSAVANLSAGMGWPLALPGAERIVRAGETLELAGLRWETRDVAGHSPGALAYYCAEASVAIVGDAVFAEGIGRYDFPHSDRRRLLDNIRTNILTLPDDVTVYSGHGPTATIGEIRTHNHYLRWELSQ